MAGDKDWPKTDAMLGDDDENAEEEEDEEEDESEEEEEEEEWTELTPPDEVDEMEDGPSTYFVRGFSVCAKLAAAVAAVQYTQDRILVFPDLYTNSDSNGEKDEVETIVLDETRLKGLHIESVPFARGVKAGYPGPRVRIPKPGRRVGPWFAYAVDQSGLEGRLAASELQGASGAAYSEHSDKQRMMKFGNGGASSGGGGSSAHTSDSHEPARHATSMSSAVFAHVLTPTMVDSSVCPVLNARLVLQYDCHALTAGSASETTVQPLRTYRRQPMPVSSDEDEEAGEEENEMSRNESHNMRGNYYSNNNNGDGENDEDGEENGEGANGGKGGMPRQPVETVTVSGLCFLHGLELQPLTRGRLRHCVLGMPVVDTHGPSAQHDTTVTAHPLTEAILERCIVYGGRQHGVYGFPRSALTLQSCLVDGPRGVTLHNTATTNGSGVSADSTLVQLLRQSRLQNRQQQQRRHGGGSQVSALKVLEYRSQLRAAGAQGGELSNTSFLLDRTRFTVPTSVACEVAIYADDAALRLQDCFLSNCRLGLVLHDGCAGTSVMTCAIRSMAEVGLYCFGRAGAAKVRQCEIAACGRECVLVAGPTEQEVRQAEVAYREEHGLPQLTVSKLASHLYNNSNNNEGNEQEDEEEEAEDNADGNEEEEDDMNNEHAEEGKGLHGKTHVPVFAQHPLIRLCSLTGSVRLQGDVRCGAMADNLVWRPQAAAASNALQTHNTNSTNNGNKKDEQQQQQQQESSAERAAADAAALASLVTSSNFGVRAATTAARVRGFCYAGVEGERRVKPEGRKNS